jgi:hypothetical protein
LLVSNIQCIEWRRIRALGPLGLAVVLQDADGDGSREPGEPVRLRRRALSV